MKILAEIRKSLAVALWFMFLTFPLMVIRVNTIEQVVVWRWRNVLFVGAGSFVLSWIWRYLLSRRGGAPADAAGGPGPWRRCSDSEVSRGATSHRAVVPIAPSRTEPDTTSRSDATSASSASNSASIRRARSRTARPWPVGSFVDRSIRVTPNSFSRRAMWADTFDCTVPSARAPPENERCSATATKALSCFRSIAQHDTNYL